MQRIDRLWSDAPNWLCNAARHAVRITRGPGRRWALLTLLALPAFWGCNPAVDRRDLGEVIFELPKVAGGDEPYDLDAKRREAPRVK